MERARRRRRRRRRRPRRARRGGHARRATASPPCSSSSGREPSTLPRATVISTRSMELLRAWRPRATRSWPAASTPTCGCGSARRSSTRRAGPRACGRLPDAPSRRPSSARARPAPCRRTGSRTVLRRHVRSLPTVRFELGTAGSSPSTTDPTACTPRSRRRDVRDAHRPARYLVAADGAHSPVRQLLGIDDARAATGAYGGVQVLFRAPLWALLGDLRYALYVVTTPDAPGLFLPAGPDDRWVYGPALPRTSRRRRPRPALAQPSDPASGPASPTSIPHRTRRRVPLAGPAGRPVPRRAGPSSSATPPTA